MDNIWCSYGNYVSLLVHFILIWIPFFVLIVRISVLQFIRNGFSVFTLTDVQEMDAIISSFNAFELKEAGPLILAWAVFLCLISSLPGKEENDVLMVCGCVNWSIICYTRMYAHCKCFLCTWLHFYENFVNFIDFLSFRLYF